jgi:hypothetical protein
LPIASPVPSAASASRIASVPPLIATASGDSAALAPFASSPNSRAVRGDTSAPTSAPSATSGTFAGRAKPSAWNAGAMPAAMSSQICTRGSSVAPMRIFASALCCVSSARAEKPPHASSSAISCKAAGAR